MCREQQGGLIRPVQIFKHLHDGEVPGRTFQEFAEGIKQEAALLFGRQLDRGGISGYIRRSSGISLATSGAASPMAWRKPSFGAHPRGVLQHFDEGHIGRRAFHFVAMPDVGVGAAAGRFRQNGGDQWVLPMPGSPPIIAMEPRPASASSRRCNSSLRSASRPISGMRSSGACCWSGVTIPPPAGPGPRAPATSRDNGRRAIWPAAAGSAASGLGRSPAGPGARARSRPWFRWRSAAERMRAAQHIAEQDAEGEEVGTLVESFAPDLLGRHVVGRADGGAGRLTAFALVMVSPSCTVSTASPNCLASPKSITLTWPWASMTLAGLRSRWTKPLLCASSSASATSAAMRKASGTAATGAQSREERVTGMYSITSTTRRVLRRSRRPCR